MRKPYLVSLTVTLLILFTFVPMFLFTSTKVAAAGTGVGNVPQGTQTNTAYANSFSSNHVTNVFATTQQTSCYTPEVPHAVNDGPNDAYSGESPCNGAATTGENPGPYPTQAGSNPGYPATSPMLVKDESESDIRVDPTDPKHLIGSSKWFVSAEGYNHLLGFYESFDGGKTWRVQGHIPGYEGWTDNTDPVGAFDGFGNYYELILAYQTTLPPMIALAGNQISSGLPSTPIRLCPMAHQIPTTRRSMPCGRCSTVLLASRMSLRLKHCLMGRIRIGPHRNCSQPPTVQQEIPICSRTWTPLA